MSTTPTTPQWAREAASEVAYRIKPAHRRFGEKPNLAAIIAKHAPAFSPPTDEAKLREVIGKALGKVLTPMLNPDGSRMGGCIDISPQLTDRVLTALAPHLSPREPGDSELLKAAKAVAGCAAIAEHDAGVAERKGLHGEQLESVQLHARNLRLAANLLNPSQAKSLAPLTPVSASNTNDTGRFAKPRLI